MPAPEFEPGQRVLVKRHGAATVTQRPPEDPTHADTGRYLVTYDDGRTYYARPDILKAMQYPPQRVLVCETTKHYRAAALAYALPTDVVLEVGCHEGVTTDILHHRCKWVLGIDKCWDPVQRARLKHPHCQLEQMDGFDIEKLCSRSPTGTFDKIFIDIGGIAELHVVMSLLGQFYRTFRSTYLIVKSKYLKNMLGNMQVWVPPGLQPKGTKPATRPGRELSAPLPPPQQQQQEEEEQQQQEQQHTAEDGGTKAEVNLAGGKCQQMTQQAVSATCTFGAAQQEQRRRQQQQQHAAQEAQQEQRHQQEEGVK